MLLTRILGQRLICIDSYNLIRRANLFGEWDTTAIDLNAYLSNEYLPHMQQEHFEGFTTSYYFRYKQVLLRLSEEQRGNVYPYSAENKLSRFGMDCG